MRTNGPRIRSRGFTLIELMVTIAVLAIALGIAAPNFTQQIRNNQSKALGEDIQGALSLARSEAIKRGGAVSLCASNAAGDGCGSDWSNGWLVVVDSESEGSASATADEVIRHWEPPEDAAVSVTRGSNVEFARFRGNGGLSGSSNDSLEITAKRNGCSGSAMTRIRVVASGSVRSRLEDC